MEQKQILTIISFIRIFIYKVGIKCVIYVSYSNNYVKY